jgi:HPt (histidine-containing phosphotransfer) domain-containing protein
VTQRLTSIPARSAPPFDRAALLGRLNGDEDLLADVVQLFARGGARLLGQLRRAVGAGDAEGLCRAAHTLKGCAGQLSAATVAGLAREMEMFGRAGAVGAAGNVLPELEGAMERLNRALREAMGGREEPPVTRPS